MKKANILIVEDEPLVALDLSYRLERMGYVVIEKVASGQEALAALTSEPADLVLMDIWIEGELDGIEAATRIRQDHDLPIIFLTSHGDEDTFKRSKAAKPLAYLLKPVEDKELDLSIRTGLYHHSLERELEMSQKALRESELHLKAVFDHSVQAFLLLDASGKALLANPTARGLFGRLFGQDPVGQAVQSVLPADKAAIFGKYFRAALEGRHERGTWRIDNGQGVCWLQYDFISVADGNGSVKQVCFSALDITERVERERKVKRSEARLRSLLQHSNEGVVLLDETGRVFDADGSESGLLSYSKAALKMSRYCEHVIDSERDTFQASLRRAAQAPVGCSEAVQYQGINARGERRFMEGAVTNLVADPDVGALVLSARDVTDRKKTEEALKQANYELDTFIYRSAHDMTAPLKSILGLVQILREQPENVDLSEFLSLIEKSVNGLDEFVNNLNGFAYSRIESVIEKVDLEATLRFACEQLNFLEGLPDVEQRVSVEQSSPFYSDAESLRVALAHLVSNSVKYRNPYVERSYFSLEAQIDERSARIVFADNGLGIRRESLPRVFEMFYRASDNSKGAGLGLYIVHKIVGNLGGDVRVSSEPGKGARFEIDLPNRSG